MTTWMHWDTGTLQPIWIVDLIFSPEKAIKKLNEIQLYNWDFEIMKLLKPKIKDYPGQHIEIKVDIPDLDFSEAKDIAKRKAKEICADPMLLSWYQGKTGESYPNLECGPGDKPAWIVYAESRGGDLTIDINEGDYIFIYLSV